MSTPKPVRKFSNAELIQPRLDFHNLHIEPDTELWHAMRVIANEEIAYRKGWNDALDKVNERSSNDRRRPDYNPYSFE